jgi:hypothetical protein
MSERPTPETDAAIKDQSKWMRPFVSTTFDGITYDSPVASLCRKLERERDEARRKLNNLDVTAIHSCHNECQRPICVAREEYATEHMLAVNKLCGERDAAREALMRIEDLFVDGTDIYADRENMGLIAREALENE